MNIKKITVNYVGTFDYFEYILTGIYNDAKEQGYTFSYKKAVYCSRLKIFMFKVTRKIFKLKNPINIFLSKKYHLCTVKVELKDRTVRNIVFDSNDTPWHFFDEQLEKCDLYYKFQCPIDYKDGYYRLNNQVIFEFNEIEKRNINKIRPLIEPRPLGRKMDFEENNRLLKSILKRKNMPQSRVTDLLVYLGNCTDTYVIPNIDHPHKKRIMVMNKLNKIDRKGIRIIFRGKSKEISSYDSSWDQYYEGLPEYKGNISYSKYLDMCFTSKATLNIAGLRGSIPFRYMDAILSDMIVLTDSPTVKWYVPFDEIPQILDIGKMGYEILSEKEFDERIESIMKIIDKIDEIRKECAFDSYQKYFSPKALKDKIFADILEL